MNTLILLHDRLSISVMLFWGAVGLWGILTYLRGRGMNGSFAGALVIGEALVIGQVVAGIALYTLGARPPSPVHYLYGITGILVIPFVWSFFRDRDQRQALLMYSLVALFIAGLAIRGMTTGRG